MKRNHTVTITLASHSLARGDVLTFADGREWDVIAVDGAQITVRRNWWRALLRLLWPFRFRGFWRRVWAR